MADIEYTYVGWADLVDRDKLRTEINESDIKPGLRSIDTNGDDLIIIFKASLDSDDLEILEGDTPTMGGILGDHDPTPEPIVNVFGGVDSAGNAVTAKFDPQGEMMVVPEAPDGDKYNQFSVNWCDKCSWYPASVKVENEELTTEDNKKFSSQKDYWIDMSHGRITQEHWITADGTYLPIIMVDGEEVGEGTDATGGGFSIDYEKGEVNFFEEQTGTVTATYWYATTGDWYIMPPAGQQLKILNVEVQFSTDLVLNSSMSFTPVGLASIWAPQLGLPAGTYVPLGVSNMYHTVKDFINESNKAYATIPAHGGPTRGLAHPVIVYVWEYLTKTTLLSSLGLAIKVSMSEDIPHGGQYSTVTFYGIAIPEA
jgi:hypothetical protein